MRARRYRVAMLDERKGGSARQRAHEAAAAGRVAWTKGDFEAALRWFEIDLGITRGLVTEQPEWAPELAATLANHGNAAQATGDLEGARASFEEALSLCREAAHDGGLPAQRELSAALGDLGRLLRALEAHGDAAALFEEDLALCRRLVEAEPDEAHQRGLAVALNHVAAESRRAGDVARARKLYEESARRQRPSLEEAPAHPERALSLGTTLWQLSLVIHPGGRREMLDGLLALIAPYVELSVRAADFGRLWDAARAALLDLEGP